MGGEGSQGCADGGTWAASARRRTGDSGGGFAAFVIKQRHGRQVVVKRGSWGRLLDPGVREIEIGSGYPCLGSLLGMSISGLSELPWSAIMTAIDRPLASKKRAAEPMRPCMGQTARAQLNAIVLGATMARDGYRWLESKDGIERQTARTARSLRPFNKVSLAIRCPL